MLAAAHNAPFHLSSLRSINMKPILALIPLLRFATAQDALRYLGRVNPATKELTWPGTGVNFSFIGTAATIGLASVSGANSANLIIDDGAPKVISDISGSAITIGPLSPGQHTVTLRRRSETELGTVSLGIVTVNGSFSENSAPSRQVEFIGGKYKLANALTSTDCLEYAAPANICNIRTETFQDSITVGYGLDGVGPGCANNASVEDNPLTYAARAANSLGADYHMVAWSGKGVVRNYAGTPADSPLMPEIWTRYGANDADDSYTFPGTWNPQAVVINLGTNDFGYLDVRDPLNGTSYTNAMINFVQVIQSHWPEAEFFLLTSPMLSDYYPTAEDAQHTTQADALKAAVEQIGDKAHLVDWPTQGSDVGCDYHPNAATHAAEAEILASAMADVLGW